jgi:hypothetical protein
MRRNPSWFALLLLSAVACTSAPIAPVPAAAPASALPSRARQADARGTYFMPAGLADDYPEESFTEAKLARDFRTLAQTGARYYRIGVGWDAIETAPDRYDWSRLDRVVAAAERQGVKLLPYVCYTPRWLSDDAQDYWRRPPRDPARFARFMAAAAARYRGRVPSWELWNEPDIPNYWLGTPAQFAQLVRAGARAVRAADPGARVVLAGMAQARSPFLERMLREERLGEVVDVINVHGYLETWDPQPAEAYRQRLQAVRALVDETAPGRDIWLAEFGYSDYRRSPSQVSDWVRPRFAYEHTPAYQAVALLKSHVAALASGVPSLVTWYRINDLPGGAGVIGDANNRHLGLRDAAGRPKPALAALRLYNRLFDEPVREVTPVATIARPARTDSVVHVFEESDGDVLVAAWLRTPPAAAGPRTGMAKDSRNETVRLRLPPPASPTPRELRVYDPSGKLVSTQPLPASGRIGDIRLRGDGIYLAEVTAMHRIRASR